MKKIVNYLKECTPETHFKIWENPLYCKLDSKFPENVDKVIFVIINQYQMVAFIIIKKSNYLYLRFYYEAYSYTSGQIIGFIKKEEALEIFESIRLEPSKWDGLKFKKNRFEYLPQEPYFFKNNNPSHLKVLGKVFKTKDFKEYVKQLK